MFECEPCQPGARLQEREAASEQDGHDQHLDDVHLPGLEQAPEQTGAAEEPDLPPGSSVKVYSPVSALSTKVKTGVSPAIAVSVLPSTA